jgi:predicted MFS family arabinose efflux permease
MVPQDKLLNAISLNNSGMNIARMVGPGIAGLLIIYIDTWGVFFLITAVYSFSAVTMVKVDLDERVSHAKKSGMAAEVLKGLSYAVKDPTLRCLIVMSAIPTFFGFSHFILLPAWAREALDAGSDELGLLMTTIGLGALVGTILLATFHDLKNRGLFLICNCVLWGISIVVFSCATSYSLALPFLFLLGMSSAVFMALNATLMQTYADSQVRGRVMGISVMGFGLMPLSALPFGALAEHVGTPFSLALSGALLIFFMLVLALFYPKARRID